MIYDLHNIYVQITGNVQYKSTNYEISDQCEILQLQWKTGNHVDTIKNLP
jgi:hypothetical protein